MKLANHDGRLALVLDDGVVDVATASDGRFGPDPMAAYDDWAALRDVGRRRSPTRHRPARRGRPRLPRAPAPRRCSPSASTTGATPRSRAWPSPTVPATFTKFPASLGGPVRRRRARRRHASTGRSSWSP